MNPTYTIKNFRVFDEQGATFEMAPITILTGCNSSGKSSITKSLILLNDMFARILNEYKAGLPCFLEDYAIRLNSGSHMLGKFASIINDKSSKEEFTIEHTAYTCFYNASITTQISFACDKSREDGNGHITKITIFDDKKNQICKFDLNTGVMTCDFAIIKEKFFKFAHYASLYNRYEPLRVKYDKREKFSNEEAKELLRLQEQLGETYLNIFTYTIPTIYKRDHLNELTKKCNLDDISSYGSLFFIDALKWLDGYKKVDVRRIVNNHIKRSLIERIRYEEQIPSIKGKIELIIDEFYRSDFKTFREFYLYYEDLFLKNVKMEFMHNENDSDYQNSFISKIEHSLAYDYAGINSYVSFIKENILEFENDVEMFWNNEEYRFIFILHYMRLIVSVEEDSKKYQDDGLNSWYNTPAFDAMILYMCNLVEDVLVDAPSFINTMRFVDAHRAHVQRLYNVQDTSLFNSLIQEYLAEKVEHPERELFEVYNPAILSMQSITVKEVAPNGRPIFDKAVIPGIRKYSLKREMDYSNRYQKGTFVKKWLHKFDIADDIAFPLSADGAGVSVELIKNGVKRNLADFGFGVTQLVAILLQIEVNILRYQKEFGGETIKKNTASGNIKDLMLEEISEKSELGEKIAPYLDSPHDMPQDLLTALFEKNSENIGSAMHSVYRVDYIFQESYLALEEPETHLHPKYQSMLADMFYDAYENYNIHFIIETHSEYLVRRTQVMVAEKKYNDAQELAEQCPFKVYYLPNPEHGKPYDMEFQITGGFKNHFDVGFFDEAGKLDMIVLQNERNLRRR